MGDDFKPAAAELKAATRNTHCTPVRREGFLLPAEDLDPATLIEALQVTLDRAPGKTGAMGDLFDRLIDYAVGARGCGAKQVRDHQEIRGIESLKPAVDELVDRGISTYVGRKLYMAIQ